MLHDSTLELAALWHIHAGEKSLCSQLEPEDFHDKKLSTLFTIFQNLDSFSPFEVQEKVEKEFKDDKPYAWLEMIAETMYLGAPYQIVSRLKKLRARREAKTFKSTAEDETIPDEFIEKGREIGDMMRFKNSAKEEIIEEIRRVPVLQPTGFSGIDYLLNGGFEQGSLNVIAARPGVGKTAIATHMSSKIVGSGVPVCFISLEMARKSIIERFMQAFWSQEVESVRKNIGEMVSLPADFIVENPSFSINKVLNAMHANLDASVFFVDYYQLIQVPGSRESQVQQLEYISNKLKQFAFENKKVVITLAQLNRQIEQDRRNREPELSDLRGCGALEQDAHVVSFLWDKNQKERSSISEDDIEFFGGEAKKKSVGKDIHWIIKKNRTGQLGGKQLDFDYKTMSFTEV